MVNTDWAKQNKELLNNYFIAWLRGVRDYCQAFHGSPLRADVVDALVKSGTERRPELLHKYPWPARSPNGQINVASMLDIQAWYLKSKMIAAQFPAERLMDTSYRRRTPCRSSGRSWSRTRTASIRAAASSVRAAAPAMTSQRRGAAVEIVGPAPRICQRAGHVSSPSIMSI